MRMELQYALLKFIERFGSAIYTDSRKFKSLINDEFGNLHQRERHLLFCALEENIVVELLSQQGLPIDARLQVLSKRLENNRALSSIAAIWTVETWAYALRLINESQITVPSLPDKITDHAKTQQNHLSSTIIVSFKGDSGHYSTITDAISHASSGTTILLRPGIYYENFTINKPITICCDGKPGDAVIIGQNGSCIEIDTPGDVILHGLTIKCNTKFLRKAESSMEILASLEDDDDMICAVIVKQGNVTIEDCSITSTCIAGIGLVGRKARALIKNSSILDSGILGILLTDNSTVVVEDCSISGNRYAGVASDNSTVEITRCKIFNTIDEECVGVGIVGSQGVIGESDIYENKMGVMATQSSSLTITNCKIYNNENFGIFFPTDAKGRVRDCEIINSKIGLGIADGSEAFVINCKIHDCELKGVTCGSASKVTIQNCKINHNDYGVCINEKSSGSITDCDLTSNVSGAYDIGFFESLFNVHRSNNKE